MKIAATIARYLLGLMFLVFGSNMFLNFIPMGPMPTGLAGQFTVALFAAHYFYVVGAIMVISAILLLANRYVAAGLTLLASGVVQHSHVSPPDDTQAVLGRARSLRCSGCWLPGSTGSCLQGCLPRGLRNDASRTSSRGGWLQSRAAVIRVPLSRPGRL